MKDFLWPTMSFISVQITVRYKIADSVTVLASFTEKYEEHQNDLIYDFNRITLHSNGPKFQHMYQVSFISDQYILRFEPKTAY